MQSCRRQVITQLRDCTGLLWTVVQATLIGWSGPGRCIGHSAGGSKCSFGQEVAYIAAVGVLQCYPWATLVEAGQAPHESTLLLDVQQEHLMTDEFLAVVDASRWSRII